MVMISGDTSVENGVSLGDRREGPGDNWRSRRGGRRPVASSTSYDSSNPSRMPPPSGGRRRGGRGNGFYRSRSVGKPGQHDTEQGAPQTELAASVGSGEMDPRTESPVAPSSSVGNGSPSSATPDAIPESEKPQAVKIVKREAEEDRTSPSPSPAPLYLMQLQYKDGQYRPDFPQGQRVYEDRNFLLVLKQSGPAMRFPDHLLTDVRLDILKRTPDGRSKLGTGGYAGGGGGGGGSGASFDFTPSYARGPGTPGGVGGGPGSGGMMMYGRDPRGGMGTPKRPSTGRRGGQYAPQHQQQHQHQHQQPQQQQRVIQLSVDEPKLQRDPNAWKPGRVEGGETAEHAELYKKVRGILNKLTPQKFDTLVTQVKELVITELPVLQKVIDMVFEKACDEPGFATAYARMCGELSTKIRVLTDDGREINFRKPLLTKCQREFEAESLYDENRDEKLIEIENAETEEKRKELTLDLEDKDRKMKRRYLGTIRFIGELFVMSMLTVKIMHECVGRLLSGWHKRKDEDSLECMCKLLATIGAKMDDPRQSSGATKGSSQMPDHQEKMKRYFDQIQAIVGSTDISSRVRFMLLDVIDLRAKKWVPRRENNNPKTIDQIHREAQAEEAKRNIEINETKQRHREAQHRPRDRAMGTPGSRGGQQQQQQQTQADDWTRVEATKKHERQNMIDRQKFDPSRLKTSLHSTMGPQGISFGPQGGAGFWGKGSGAGATGGSPGGSPGGRLPETSANKFAALGDDRNRTLPPRMRQNTQDSRSSQRTFRGPEVGVRPSSSMGSTRDGSTSHAEDIRKHGATASMILPREMNAEYFSSGPQQSSGLPGTPIAASTPMPEKPVLATPSAVASSDPSSPFKGSPNASRAECADFWKAITTSHCSKDCDVSSESVDVVIEKFHEKTLHWFVREGLNRSADKSAPFRKAFGKLLGLLVQRDLLTAPIFVKGMSEFLADAEADDLLGDVPKLWAYVGESLGPMFAASGDRITLCELKKCNTPYLGKIFASILHTVFNHQTESDAAAVWQKGSLQPEDLAAAGVMEDFLRKENIEFMKDVLKGEWMSEKTAEKFRAELTTYLMARPAPSNDAVINWLIERVPEVYRGENHFVRSLAYVLIHVAMSYGKAVDSCDFDKNKFLARVPVLSRFIDGKPDAELQTLIAATHISADKNHPRGLMTELFELLDEFELIGEDIFNKWYEDGTGVRGYGIAHEAVKQFYTWMRTAPTEDEAEEEKVKG